ncbi:MAG: hypothetical protein J7L89_05150, partial [Bacteroidales bacterium]|nr:hypothetical protein [Bacteroidales bacterium]
MTAWAQEEFRFKPDIHLLESQFKSFFEKHRQNPERTHRLLSRFESFLDKGQLDENQVANLTSLANKLLIRGARPYPHFDAFLNCFMALTEKPGELANYRVWSKYLGLMLNRKNVQLNLVTEYLLFCKNFTLNGTLYRSGSFYWSIDPDAGSFVFDTTFHVVTTATDLKGGSQTDSLAILQTSGSYDPFRHLWSGSGGQVTWERVKLPADQIVVQLADYSLNLSRSVYRIDSVNLIDHRYFEFPVNGFLEDKILPGVKAELAGYPRFTSYDQQNLVKNIFPGMDYRGGFTLRGRKVIGSGLPDRKSELLVYRDQIPLMRLASTYFVFENQRTRGINTQVSIYLQEDSIFHPGLLFQYSNPRGEISLIRNGKGLSESRYFDTYHQLDLDVEMIQWHRGDSLMVMRGMIGSIENRASFESADYFSIDRFNEILLMDKNHPVA